MSKPPRPLKQTMRRFPTFMRLWLLTSCCRRRMWWIQAILMRKQLVHSRQDYDVDLFGPTREDDHWQARENNGFAASHFDIDWQHECATCPAGKISSSWSKVEDRRGNPVIKIKFAVQDCRSCLSRSQCTQSQSNSPRRVLTVRPEPQ
jgi:transposase